MWGHGHIPLRKKCTMLPHKHIIGLDGPGKQIRRQLKHPGRAKRRIADRARLILMRSVASCYPQPWPAGVAFGGRWARVREFVAEPASGAGSEPICMVAHPPFADASASQNDRLWSPCYSVSLGLYCSACASGCPDVVHIPGACPGTRDPAQRDVSSCPFISICPCAAPPPTSCSSAFASWLRSRISPHAQLTKGLRDSWPNKQHYIPSRLRARRTNSA